MSSNTKQDPKGSSHGRSHSAHDSARKTTFYDFCARVGELEFYEMANKGTDWWIAHWNAVERNEEKAVRRQKKLMEGNLKIKEYWLKELERIEDMIAAKEAERALLVKRMADIALMTQKPSSE